MSTSNLFAPLLLGCLGLLLGPAPLAWTQDAGEPDSAQEEQPAPAKQRGGRQQGGGGEGSRLARRELERDREVTAHFEICDLDSNGWVSFREAAVTLGIEKAEFRLYDTNQDGRLDQPEFRERYQTILGLLGAVRPPVRPDPDAPEGEPEEEAVLITEEGEPPKVKLPETFPSATDLLNIYDRDRTGGLAEAEVHALFNDIGGVLSADVVSRQMDPDKSGELELTELGPLALLVSRRLPKPGSSPRGGTTPEATELVEIYRITLPRKLPDGAPPQPPRILGPVTHFRRLDLWNDGFIDPEDLRQLLSPARLNVRPTAVIAALDQNGDGQLDEDEFLTCLRND